MDDLDDDVMDDEEDVDEVASGTGWGDFVAFMERLSSLWDFLDI